MTSEEAVAQVFTNRGIVKGPDDPFVRQFLDDVAAAGYVVVPALPTEGVDEIGEWRNSEGGLDCSSPYVAFAVGDKDVTLEGEFTSAEIRAIADHMDKAAAARRG